MMNKFSREERGEDMMSITYHYFFIPKKKLWMFGYDSSDDLSGTYLIARRDDSFHAAN